MNYQGAPLPIWVKFGICLFFDFIDFTIGRLMFGVSLMTEVGTAAVMFFLWGPIGLIALWEGVDLTEQIDGFVPTSTIIAFMAHNKQSPKPSGMA